MIGNDVTFKLTIPQVRFLLNLGSKAHHATLKSLKAKELIGEDGRLTLTGQAVVGELLNRMVEAMTPAQSRAEAITAFTNSRKLHIVEVKNSDRLASTFTAEEYDQLKQAVTLVAETQRETWDGYDEPFTVLAALEDVWNTVALPGRGCIGATEMDDTGDEVSEAFKLVLTYPKAVRQIVEFSALAA